MPLSSSAKDPGVSALVQDKTCIVVGGGPVGLATALTLSRPPHCYNIKVLERSKTTKDYDPARSYLYNINSRGLVWFHEQHQRTTPSSSALSKLQERGLDSKMAHRSVRIPADPNAPIVASQDVRISNAIPAKNKQKSRSSSYWIPRHQMMELLTECCVEQTNAAATATQNSSDINTGLQIQPIEICEGKEVDSIRVADDNRITVSCRDGSNYTASLLVGADGFNSCVRTCLANTNTTTTQLSLSWLQSKPKSFSVRRYRSPATGLKLKALQLRPNFVLRNKNGDDHPFPTESTTFYVFQNQWTGFRNRLALGLLPIKDPNMVRPANTITPPDHEIWSCTIGPEAKAWFTRAFPRLHWDDLVVANGETDNRTDHEWERFARARGTTFPHCQYSPGSALAEPLEGLTGVVLVGDACHAFPPDIGQGINSGLQDVVTLDRALRGCVDLQTGNSKHPPTTERNKPLLTLGAALDRYQCNRGPEHRALIRLALFGAPYQYRQPWLQHRIGRWLWTANVVARMLLNKLSLGYIPPAAVAMMANSGPETTYREIMRRADLTTLGLNLVLWVVAPLVSVVVARSRESLDAMVAGRRGDGGSS